MTLDLPGRSIELPSRLRDLLMAHPAHGAGELLSLVIAQLNDVASATDDEVATALYAIADRTDPTRPS